VKIVRRHRRKILILLSLLALTAMTFGYLRRIGVDPLTTSGEPDPASEGSGR